MSKSLFRKELSKLQPYVPGKPIEEVQKEYGLTDVVKLASNENQLGPSPKAVEAVKNELKNLNIYPDAGAMELRHALAEKYGLEYENIVVGNGGEQVLQIIAQTFINTGDEAIMADTTFGIYSNSVTHMGGIPVEIPLTKDYKHDFKAFVENVNDKTKLIYVCNPNNPIPNIMAKEEINYLVDNVPEDVVIVFDEAYYDFARVNPDYPETLEILNKRPNTIILRTFSKVSGLAAVRVGFALTSKEIATEMSKVKGVFNVNRLAQVAALAALEDQEHIDKTVELNYKSLKIMEEAFDDLGLEYVKSNANFTWVNIGISSKDVFEELLKRGVIIRPGHLWGWDNWLRVSTGTVEQTEKFITELKNILNK
ncbi:histidinol-phosphate aminotransferase [Keratinibaculum paraultunense]|uniref:Histidinol-phosphate aminotransferase n=1 Tax=Keratinibaculum paraultunense TaxID=1278232 RepID=A0A4R3KZI1_9FIRM|nr:histidinol-phosphate transaminase [Keratinibaculum paraultunense]QQY80117.1 histidinol-phosphate transaminase [Keratinibaculum paraultunense]TCS91562.1 histidinol-phosphate aminotransferase [Keratinibaculum paraultunense]